MGSNFHQYATTHAGLGIWDKSNGVKLTIEFVADNFISAFFPLFINDPIKTIQWNNSGTVIVTIPMDENGWDNSRHISSATGVAYTELKSFLQSHVHTIYQPITIIEASINDIINGTFSVSKTTIQSQNSYWFVSHTIQNLASFGCSIESFIPTSASGIFYITPQKITPEIIFWDIDESTRLNVYNWYLELQSCYLEKAQHILQTRTGAELFLKSLQLCFFKHSYAYIYASPNSVYNITLLSVTSNAPTVTKTIITTPSLRSLETTAIITSQSTSTSNNNNSHNNASGSTNSSNSTNHSTNNNYNNNNNHRYNNTTNITSESPSSAPTSPLIIIDKYHNTPQLIRFAYHLPPPPKYTPLLLTSIDYLVTILTVGCVSVAMLFGIFQIMNDVSDHVNYKFYVFLNIIITINHYRFNE